MSIRSSLRTELGPLLKKRLRRFFISADEGALVYFYNEIDGQLKEFFDRHPELDTEPDVRQIIGTALTPLVDKLEASAKTLENMISSYGEVTKGKMLAKEVRVRSKGRATLSMFPPGTRLRVRELRRMNGSLGGVELVVKE